MDGEVVLVEDLRAFRRASRNTSRHALRKVVGQADFRYSSNSRSQEWLNTIMVSERKNAGTHSKPLIQKAPEMLRDTKDFKAYYEPRVVSIGPYHNSDKKLRQVEQKSIVLRQFLEISDYSEGFFDQFARQIMKLKERYDKDSTKDNDGETFAQMVFLDGCFVLYFIYCIVTHGVKNLGMKNHLIALVQ